MPVLRQINRQFPDVHMLSVTNQSDETEIEDFWREFDGTLPVASDPSHRTNDRFGVHRVAILVTFDAHGTFAWRDRGLAGTT